MPLGCSCRRRAVGCALQYVNEKEITLEYVFLVVGGFFCSFFFFPSTFNFGIYVALLRIGISHPEL